MAADVDGDDDIDVLTASYADDTISWYENDSTPGDGGWTGRAITTTSQFAYSVHAADVDGDGDIDVISSSLGNDTVAWYENDGTPAQGNWTARNIAVLDFPTCVHSADVDGDGDMDIVSLSRYDDLVVWLENDGTPTNGGWTVRTITTTADGAFRVFAADMDGDGDLDVLSASQDDDTIAWYENDGSPANDAFWISNTITTAVDVAIGVYAADVDGDGDLDAISASVNDYKIAWYENLGASLGDYNVDGEVDDEDYDYWTSHFGENSGPGLTADGNGDEAIDAADYVVWRKVYGTGGDGGGSIGGEFTQVASPILSGPGVAKVSAAPSFVETPVSFAPVMADAPMQRTPTVAPSAAKTLAAVDKAALSMGPVAVDRVFQRWNAPRTELLLAARFASKAAEARADYIWSSESCSPPDSLFDAAISDLENVFAGARPRIRHLALNWVTMRLSHIDSRLI
jgi:hypothetical protein